MRAQVKSVLRDQSGIALVIALVMMIVFTVIGIALTFTATFESKLSGNKRGSTDAFFAAESGLQSTRANLANFDISRYVLVPNTGSLPVELRGEVDRIFSTPDFSLPSGVDFNERPQVTMYHVIREGGEGVLSGIRPNAYIIESTGRDQIGIGPLRPSSQVREKWLIYDLGEMEQGGG